MLGYRHTFWTHVWTGSICPPVETQSSLHTCSSICFQVMTQRRLFVSTVTSVILACSHIQIRVHQWVTLKIASKLNISGKYEATLGINTHHNGWLTLSLPKYTYRDCWLLTVTQVCNDLPFQTFPHPRFWDMDLDQEVMECSHHVQESQYTLFQMIVAPASSYQIHLYLW